MHPLRTVVGGQIAEVLLDLTIADLDPVSGSGLAELIAGRVPPQARRGRGDAEVAASVMFEAATSGVRSEYPSRSGSWVPLLAAKHLFGLGLIGMSDVHDIVPDTKLELRAFRNAADLKSPVSLANRFELKSLRQSIASKASGLGEARGNFSNNNTPRTRDVAEILWVAVNELFESHSPDSLARLLVEWKRRFDAVQNDETRSRPGTRSMPIGRQKEIDRLTLPHLDDLHDVLLMSAEVVHHGLIKQKLLTLERYADAGSDIAAMVQWFRQNPTRIEFELHVALEEAASRLFDTYWGSQFMWSGIGRMLTAYLVLTMQENDDGRLEAMSALRGLQIRGFDRNDRQTWRDAIKSSDLAIGYLQDFIEFVPRSVGGEEGVDPMSRQDSESFDFLIAFVEMLSVQFRDDIQTRSDLQRRADQRFSSLFNSTSGVFRPNDVMCDVIARAMGDGQLIWSGHAPSWVVQIAQKLGRHELLESDESSWGGLSPILDEARFLARQRQLWLV